MNIVCDLIRDVEPDRSSPVRLRAVRPDGAVLIEESVSPGHSGYPIHSGSLAGWVTGEYEWQQRIGNDWVTLSRYVVSAS
jgi:hypothetical protein